MKRLKGTLVLCAAMAAPVIMAENVLHIDAARRGHDINQGMYGIFFEEINHSGDGGMYAELLQNRGFEEQTIPGGFSQIGTNKIQTPTFVRYTDLQSNQLTWDWNFAAKKMTGWQIDSDGCTVDYGVEEPSVPLHEATPNAMRLTMSNLSTNGRARLVNTGYWGIAVESGEKYDLRFYLNTADYTGKVKAVILDSDGKEELASVELDVDKSGNWKEYKSVLIPKSSVKDGKFALVFSGEGTVWADYVSLFPQNTYCNRPNGLRPDLAQMLVDLKPKFLRWPGGCIVEGIMLENRVKWKETIGDPMTRPGQYDLWGYRSTWGMGYHEILQFCEDAGMDCMFVGNAGLSCIGWGGQYVSGDAVEPYYEDIRDAIEYAIGDPATNEWAARRAEAGHPDPFPLKYVEIGNENFGARYDANYKYIYNKLKAEYPQLTFLNTMGLDHAVEFDIHTDMIDPHWYVSPDFFYNNRTLFDNVPRGNYEIYVGEYATNVGVGQGNMDASLSEAVFMMSMERNSDIVKMASYAPLITNDNAPNWTCNLIWQHSGEVFGRASYYVQKMFAENLPDYNIASALHSSRIDVPYNGRVGIGTWETAADFRNLKISTPDGTTLYSGDFDGARNEWTDMQGTWSPAEDGMMNQSNSSLTRCITLMNRLSFRDCVIEVEARKNSGKEGFLLVFGCDDEDWGHYYQFNVGGWNNAMAGLEEVTNGVGGVISDRPSFRIENNRWYKLKVVCHNGKIEAYIDEKLYCSKDFGTEPTGRVGAHVGYDVETGEIVAKVVNAEGEPMPMTLDFNAKNIAATASVETLKAATLWDENSFSTPTLISPVKSTINGVGAKTEYTFEPYSLTIIRVKADPADASVEFPAFDYSSEPRELNPVVETGKSAMLREMVAEAKAVAFSDVEGYEALTSAATTAGNVLAGGDEDAIAAAIAPMKQALDGYYKGLMIESNELTGRVVNPHFDRNGVNEGWGGNPTVRDHVAEIFNSGFNVSQTVTGLEDGYYLVYFQGYYRNGNHPDSNARHADGSEQLLARFTLNDMDKPVVSLMGEVHDGYWWGAPNTMAEAHAVFSQSPDHYANYLIARVVDGELTISLNKSKLCDADWFCFDNVRLFRVETSYTAIEEIDADAVTGFSPDAVVYDIQGRLMGGYAGLRHLSPGVYVVAENGRSLKVVKK